MSQGWLRGPPPSALITGPVHPEARSSPLLYTRFFKRSALQEIHSPISPLSKRSSRPSRGLLSSRIALHKDHSLQGLLSTRIALYKDCSLQESLSTRLSKSFTLWGSRSMRITLYEDRSPRSSAVNEMLAQGANPEVPTPGGLLQGALFWGLLCAGQTVPQQEPAAGPRLCPGPRRRPGPYGWDTVPRERKPAKKTLWGKVPRGGVSLVV